MTVGLLLVFVGIQLYFVETYVLTPQATKIVGQKLGDTTNQAYQGANDFYNNPNGFYQNAGYTQDGFSNNSFGQNVAGSGKRLSPPRWICWPIFFLGAVFFLHALALPAGGYKSE